MKVCTVEGCESTKYKANGFCMAHYEKNRRYGDPLADGRAIYREQLAAEKAAVGPITEKQCKTCKQVKPIEDFYVRDGTWVYTWCKACHKDRTDAGRMQNRLDNPPKPKTPVDHGQCSYELCEAKAKVRNKDDNNWYCTGHWQQWWSGREMTDLRPSSKSYIDERFRRCTKCKKVKTHDDFHNRTNGNGKQSVCKECTLLATRFNALLAQDRFEEALAKTEEMPEVMQKHYLSRLASRAS